MLVPFSWQRTQRNLQAAITSSIASGDFWARSRNLKFLRHVHRLDAETTGVLLLARSLGAIHTYGRLFESRRMEKVYLAVVHGAPAHRAWTCTAPLEPDPKQIGRMRVAPRHGKSCETAFRVIERRDTKSLVEARPLTGRTHQIRVHLLESGHPVIGDELYGPEAVPGRGKTRARRDPFPLALRAIALDYFDPFQRRPIHIEAPDAEFLAAHGFASDPQSPSGAS
jgi:23S rRNA pseudouridine1911/1915/1917 synthase